MNTAADRAQRSALDPAMSVWVSASAGTGKTKVLTERLLTLMLEGTDPSRLLCLTFTRAAAAEMANRVNTTLARWTTLEPGALHQELVALLGRRVDARMQEEARRLFARVLEAPGGVKIATIHAFCQSLLRRFPLEADVPPEFAVIEERSAKDALEEAGAQVIARARDGVGELAEALAVVAGHVAEERFGELIEALAAERSKLREAVDDGGLLRRLCAAFGLDEHTTPADLMGAFCAGGDAVAMRGAAEALAQGSPTDRKRAECLAAWWDGPGARPEMIADYAAVFLTKDGDPRKQLFGKAAAKQTSLDLAAVLGTEAERVLRYRRAAGSAAVVEATHALATLGHALLGEYERHKALRGQLDYDDLIAKSVALLSRPGIAPWVLFKLDGGLDHILIDEAQDTNPEQWEIVALLSAEFFSGEGASARPRTIFAVGDAKQSIYSFQRADPHAFLTMRRHFEARVNEARQGWRIVPLDISFRAAPPLLQAIDAVFAHDAAADGVALDGRAIGHVAARTGHAGLVELWPPVVAEAEAEEGTRTLEPQTRLAHAIAKTIAQWLRTGERLESKDRPIRAGDVLVLVRRRGKFVGDLLRALKRFDVPVAGADRLQLTEQLAVQDLIALGQFLLLPEDDLTLATVLKGPLFGISEDALFRLAYDRGRQNLWQRLRRDAELREVSDRLAALLNRADFTPPYELYATILSAEGGKRAMLERLGAEAADPIEEFLALALAYEREHVPSLQGFLHWLVAGDIEVKRDFGERQRDEVRIMTVHGAKGLEAPIVFVPDSMQLPDMRVNLLWTAEAGLPLWRPRASLAAPLYEAERAAARRRDLQEYRRLLYVALTRAQDRLYVCGWEPGRASGEAANWHMLCRQGWTGIMTPFAFDSRPLIGERGWSGEGLRLSSAQTAPPDRDRLPAAALVVAPTPDWADRPPPPEPNPPKPLLPSRPSGAEPATLSPLVDGGRDRFKRGLLVHRLLQSLPELPAVERDAAARRFLALPTHALPEDEQDEIRRETLAVLAEPEFAAMWGPDAQAEVPVVGLIGGQALSGQIDRIVVTPDRVLIVDYKSVRPPPETPDSVAAPYLRQLATYRAALRLIYPDRAVECALLWTAAPRLMSIDATLLDRHAPPTEADPTRLDAGFAAPLI